MTTARKSYRPAELTDRGWTKDMCSIYLRTANAWYSVVDVASAESTTEWRADALRARRGLAVAFRRPELRQRGWSDTMINDLLDEPVVLPLNRSGTRTAHLWRAAIVEQVEDSPEFCERAGAWPLPGLPSAAPPPSGDVKKYMRPH